MQIKSFKDFPKNILYKLYEDPVFFSRLCFNSYLWSKQREILYALVNYKKVAVYSATGTGKSFLCANLVPWFLQTRKNSIVIIVGANYKSTLRTLWRPCVSLYYKSRFKLKGEPDTSKWSVSKGQWYAEVCSARKIEALQGLHSENALFILEEASGLDSMVYDALEGNLTGGNYYVLQIGNPLRPYGDFYETQFYPDYYKVKISIFDTPNFTGEDVPEHVKKFLPDERYVKTSELRYGKDSAFWKAKVLGEFPKDNDYLLFDVDLLEIAFNNDNYDLSNRYKYLTVDCARYGEDNTVYTLWEGNKNYDIILEKNTSIDHIAGMVVRLNKEHKFDYIIIDETGLGSGVVDVVNSDNDIISSGAEVVGVNFSQKAFNEEMFDGIITEAAFNFKDALKLRKVKLFSDYSNEIKKQLSAFKYEFNKSGAFKLVDIRQLKRELKKSPDIAMALLLRFVSLNSKLGIY